MSFLQFGFHPSIQKQIESQNYSAPTPIQQQAITPILKGDDVVGLAQTGTGKTAAFVLPLVQRLIDSRAKGISALILTPTRELAEQVSDVVKTFSHGSSIRSACIYGGVSFSKQIQDLKRGPQVVIACPGRLLDHIQKKTVNLSAVKIVVLDEADQLHDMGFFPNVRTIMRSVPQERQTLFFSATMPSNIEKLANESLRNPVRVQVARLQPTETVKQMLLPITTNLKKELLVKVLRDIPAEESVLVFTRTKHRAKSIDDALHRSGFATTSLQGNLSQNRRAAAMKGFRSGKYQVMVATDIAARGIDVSQVFHVINFDFPDTVEAYTHRIGRTGRASQTGTSYTFITPEDRSGVRYLERSLKRPIERLKVQGFDYGAVTPDFEAPSDQGQKPNRNRPFRSNKQKRWGSPSQGRRQEGRPHQRSQQKRHSAKQS